MTFEEFKKLPIGANLYNNGIYFKKTDTNDFVTTNTDVQIFFKIYENHYYIRVGRCGYFAGPYPIENFSNDAIKHKEQPIESLLSEKKELEEKIKNIDEKISAHKENVLNNLVPGEWYKIQTDYSSGYFVRKFVKYVDRGDGEIYLITKYQTGQDDSLQKKKIKSIIHIPGAKEAEETFLNMLKG